MFIGRTDAEAEAPILWPPNVNEELIYFRIVWFDLLSVQEAAESETLGETVVGQSEALGP